MSDRIGEAINGALASYGQHYVFNTASFQNAMKPHLSGGCPSWLAVELLSSRHGIERLSGGHHWRVVPCTETETEKPSERWVRAEPLPFYEGIFWRLLRWIGVRR